MISDIGIAVNSYGKAFELLFKKGIRKFLLLPVLINIALLVIVILNGIFFVDEFGAWLYSVLPEMEIPGWVDAVLGWVMIVFLIGIYIIFYKYLVLVVLSPFMAILSEKVEKEINGREFPFSWGQLGRDVLRAIAINFRNFMFEILATILFSILAFIPVIGLLSPVAILLVQSYFFGFAMMDFNAERHRMSRKATEKYMRANKWTVTGVGLLFYITYLIPVLGWIIGPVLGTIAGTISFLRSENPSRMLGSTGKF